MRKTVIIFLLLFISISTTHAQRLPFFTHYYNNPYLYNPAYAGYDKHTVFYLTHRQQWLGIEGAPVSSQLSFHSPMGNANPLFIGADIIDDRLGALKHNAIKFSLGYMLPLSSEHEHYLKTAFSTGIGMHSYDLAGMDIGDDIILQSALNNRTFLDGRVGFHYHNRGFNLSASLPHLFSPPPVFLDGFSNVAFDQFSRMIFSSHYRFNFNPEGTLAFEPTVLYHYSKEDVSQLEALGILYVKNAFWVGGGYQQQSGISGTAGVQVKGLKISYAYTMGGSEVSPYGMGTHEAQVGIVIGKKKEVLKRKPRLSTQNTIDDIPDQALLEKHAKSKEKRRKKESKAESVPDRKKVSPSPTVVETQPSPVDNKTADNDTVIEENKTEERTISQAVEQKPATSQTQPSAQVGSQQQKKDYEDIKFDSFDSDKKGVIQLGEPTKAPAIGTNNNTQAKPIIDEQAVIATPSQQNKTEEKPAQQIEWDTTPQNKTNNVADTHPLAMKNGFYIIAGTFSTQANAEKLADKLKAQGFFPEVGYHSEKQYFYVHIFQSANKDEALKELERLKQNAAFQQSWILNVEP
ncbi:PorP/SprF family type IX secretion system membrane protein [Catalinimonas niigatensis]|uniref:PorP/SprF family type IX secretion system membrane protein n=1 Tax=Catalinimonas niigatensis TaxID=1397264 RepID=UPI00266699F7|nr:PorP/SprF family type IX secretion system membrane protein [Catalinimonas niigatensis]WPP52541.1 PorP/SprF family type IX secretion system membrane protein [Catalinimonas niigatensis]